MSQPYHRGANTNMAHHRGSNSGGWGTREQRVEEGNRTLMEMENDAKWAELGEQVNLLKNISLDMQKEVKEQNSLLDMMGSGFNSASGLFQSTLGKMGQMMSNSSSQHMYYLIGNEIADTRIIVDLLYFDTYRICCSCIPSIIFFYAKIILQKKWTFLEQYLCRLRFCCTTILS